MCEGWAWEICKIIVSVHDNLKLFSKYRVVIIQPILFIRVKLNVFEPNLGIPTLMMRNFVFRQGNADLYVIAPRAIVRQNIVVQ